MSRRRLGAELRRLREDAGMTLEQAANALECSMSKISRLETGKGLPKQRDVRDLTRLYGKAAEGRLEPLLRLAREGARAGWWQEYTPLLTAEPFVFDGADRYVALESDASWLRAYDPTCFHGLLQSEVYIRGLLGAVLPHHPQDEIEKLVEFRLRRQEVLTRNDSPLEVHEVIDESVFRRTVGDDAVMVRQLDHLIELSSLANLTIQILPFTAGFLRATGAGQFLVLGFDYTADQDVVFVESHSGTSFLEGDFGVETFKRMFKDVRARALGPLESLEWMRRERASYQP
jgi:transcriptional regulator with XRE-family HTH domain